MQQGDWVWIASLRLKAQVQHVRGRSLVVARDHLRWVIHSTQAQVVAHDPKPEKKSTWKHNQSQLQELGACSSVLDMHGVPIEQAVEAMERWLDKACVLHHGPLKLIHGKGKGILRKHLHEALRSNSRVVILREPPYASDGGVTWLGIR